MVTGNDYANKPWRKNGCISYAKAIDVIDRMKDGGDGGQKRADILHAIDKILSMETINAVTKQQLRNALTWIWKDREKHGYLIDLWVRDKANGEIHRLGDDQHDGIWVSYDGTVHFSNLQNGDGCGAHSLTDELAGYEFCPSDYGRVDEEYLIAVKGETVFSPD